MSHSDLNLHRLVFLELIFDHLLCISMYCCLVAWLDHTDGLPVHITASTILGGSRIWERIGLVKKDVERFLLTWKEAVALDRQEWCHSMARGFHVDMG